MKIQILYSFLLFTIIIEQVFATNNCDIFGNCLRPQVADNDSYQEIVVEDVATHDYASEIVTQASSIQQFHAQDRDSERVSVGTCSVFTKFFPFSGSTGTSTSNKRNVEIKECSVCLSAIGDDCYETECHHYFHGECIKNIKTSCTRDVRDRCP
eukprot:Pgem_evm4s2241